jgi:hypothetical protein
LSPTTCVGVDLRFAALLASAPLDGFGHQPFHPERGGASLITWPNGGDIVKIKIGELVSGGRVRSRAIVVQQKTGRPGQFELLEPARGSLLA